MLNDLRTFVARSWIVVAVACWLGASLVAAAPDAPAQYVPPGLPAKAPTERPVVSSQSDYDTPDVAHASRVTVRQPQILNVDANRSMKMIRLEILIGDVPSKAAVGEKTAAEPSPEEIRRQMEVLVQAELTALENFPAFIRFGRREARIAGVTTTNTGVSNSVTIENLGANMAFTCRVAADGSVIVELDIEDSRHGPLEEGTVISAPTQGEPIRTPNTELFTTQTTLHIRDGQTVVAGGMAPQAKSKKERVVLVTAHVLGKGESEDKSR